MTSYWPFSLDIGVIHGQISSLEKILGNTKFQIFIGSIHQLIGESWNPLFVLTPPTSI